MRPFAHAFARALIRAAILPALALEIATCAACEGCHRSSGTAPAAGPAVDTGAPTLRLYLVTDLAGALEPCGCTKDQLGGIDHFGAWVRASAAQAPASLVAAAGPTFFMDGELAGERADQDRSKAETIARVLHRLDFAAFAPGANDWADGRMGLQKLGLVAGAAAIVPSASPPFAWTALREAGPLKVGFVGYGDPGPALASPTAEEAVRRGVEDVKRQGANVLVALVSVGRGQAKRIADAVPELTAVVVGSARSAGDANTTAPQGERVGDVLIAQASNHLQTVAVLDLYARDAPPAGKLVKFADGTGLELSRAREDSARQIDELYQKIAAWERDKSVSATDLDARRADLARLEAQRDRLDTKAPPAQGSYFRYTNKEIRSSLGKDAAIETDMAAYYKAVNDHNRQAFADRVPAPAAPGKASYVGIDTCSNCHAAARTVWDGTVHAHAYATLSTQFKEFNLECVSCHVTGYDEPGGSTVTHVDKLENVQCEVCHGPGSRHVANPADPATIVARPDPSMCVKCHHAPHVEQFDAVGRLKDILGPGHGLPSR